MRSHNQFNTTICGHNHRYCGIRKGRHVVFLNPQDVAKFGLENGQLVDVHGGAMPSLPLRAYGDPVDAVLAAAGALVGQAADRSGGIHIA